MAVKTAFEPKDARINFDDRFYSDDFDEKRGGEPRKRITGTQALVEFLNTTSPEEFQKNVVPTKRSSALFFRRKGEKPTTKNVLLTTKNTSTSPHTIHRKNYIEIIANPFTFNKSKISTSPSSISQTTTTKNNSSSTMIGSELNKSLSKSSASIYSLAHHNNNDKPVLPIRKTLNAVNATVGSTNTTTTTNGTQTSAITLNNNRRQIPSLRVSTLVDQPTTAAHSIFTTTNISHDDMIEGGLKQRLNQYQINSVDVPSDAISKSLAQEHLVALGVVSSMMMDEQDQQQTSPIMKRKKKSRHIQVQTMPYYPNENNTSKAVTVQTEDQPTSHSSSSSSTNQELLLKKFEKMEQELKQERLKNSRLQAALEDTRDQFEVLSGLAYKKLREVWEEKTKWENACIEAKERCWHEHQQQIMARRPTEEEDDVSSTFIDGTIMEFMLDQDIIETRQQQQDEEDEEYLL